MQFGFSDGRGIRNMVEIASTVSRYYGVRIDCFGIAFRDGMPEPADHRDHPELYIKGDFPVSDPAALENDLRGRATLYLSQPGDLDYAKFIADSVGSIAANPLAPIGFIEFDLDTYSLTKRAMAILKLAPRNYLPTTPLFFDQTSGHINLHRFCGELLAIDEFNASETRKITKDTAAPYTHRHVTPEPWLDRCYLFQVFDHPNRRTSRTKPRTTPPFATRRTESFFRK